MKNIKFKIMFVLTFVLCILPIKGYALELTDENTVGYIKCADTTNPDASVDDVTSVKKGDVLLCTYYAGTTVADVSMKLDASEGKYKITNGSYVENPAYILESGSNSGDLRIGSSTFSGDKTQIGYFKIEVSGSSGELKIELGPIKYIGTLDDGSGDTEEDEIDKTIIKKYTIEDSTTEPEPTLSNDATLKKIAISDLSSFKFEKNIVTYLSLKTDKAKINIDSIETNHSSATKKVKLNGEEITSIKNIPLIIGENTIEIIVTAEDGTTTKTYKLNITRKKIASTTPPSTTKSNDSSISSLKINGEKINITNGKYDYTMTVSNSTTSLNLSYTLNNEKASATTSGTNNLVEGDNLVTVEVTAEDGSTSTYKITVTRTIKVPKSGVSYPVSIILLGIIGIAMYIKFKNRSYIKKI